jgi:hypothetical protein
MKIKNTKEKLKTWRSTDWRQELHFEGRRLRCTSEESCFSQNLSKEEIVVPMVGCIMLKQFNTQSATCWIRCLIISRISGPTLSICQDKRSGTTCWTGCPSLSRTSYTGSTWSYLMNTCYWTQLDDSLLIKGLLQEICNKPMCWIWPEVITNLIKDLLESLSYRINFKIKFILKLNSYHGAPQIQSKLKSFNIYK